MKRVLLCAIATVVVFGLCFMLVWNIGRAFVQVVPALNSTVGIFSLVIGLAMTAYVVRALLNARRR